MNIHYLYVKTNLIWFGDNFATGDKIISHRVIAIATRKHENAEELFMELVYVNGIR